MKRILIVLLTLIIVVGCTDGKKDVNKPTKPVFTTEPVSITTTPSPTEEKEKTLLDIMKEKKWEEAKKLILEGWEVNVEERKEEILTPLIIASEEGQKDIVELLIEKGAEVETESGYVALVKAIEKGNNNIANILLENKAPIEFNSMSQPFFTALNTENFKMAEIILGKVTDRQKIVDDALFRYVYQANLSVTEFLIGLGVDVNKRDEFGSTLLHYAAYALPDDYWSNQYIFEEDKVIINEEYCNKIKEDYIKIINMLVNSGAEIDARENEWGFTPLMNSAKNGNVQRAEALIELGADVNARATMLSDATVLHIALTNTNAKFIEMLIDHGADVNAKDNGGATPIFYTIDNPDLTKIIIESGADLNIRNNEGETVLMMAQEYGNDEIVEILKEAGAKE